METRKHMENNINMDFRQVARILDAGTYKTYNTKKCTSAQPLYYSR